MSKFYVSGIVGLVVLLSGCGAQNPTINTTTSTPNNNQEEKTPGQTETENSAYENWNTFVNPDGGYGFLYSPTWNAAINVYNNNFTLFGQGVTGQSGMGGVEVREDYKSIKAYLDSMEDEVGVKYVTLKNVNIDGVTGIRAEYTGYPVKGHVVVLLKNNKIYNIYLNSNEAEEVALFDKLTETFVFSE